MDGNRLNDVRPGETRAYHAGRAGRFVLWMAGVDPVHVAIRTELYRAACTGMSMCLIPVVGAVTAPHYGDCD